MRVLTCSTDVVPCPPSDQVWTSLLDLLDPELLGITPEIVATVMLWGFGFVFGAWLMGYSLALATGMVKKL